ncbi:hypothetical protein [Nitratifractor sp.]
MGKGLQNILGGFLLLAGIGTIAATAQQGRISMHGGDTPSMASHIQHRESVSEISTATDKRIAVSLPLTLREHMLASMRDHLETIHAILKALNNGKFDEAARLAESKLGMSSLGLHGAKRAGRYMPEGMRRAGLALHKAATRFALKAQEEDLPGSYRALEEMTATCVACHAAYRVR